MTTTPTLVGQHVVLEPLAPQHYAGLADIARDPSVWTYMIDRIHGDDDVERWATEAAGPRFHSWVTVERASGQVIGSTRFIDLDLRHRNVEIGNTFLASHARGTTANPEAKLLQLTYAFETLNLRRVALKTHHLNQHSQNAMRKLGAQYEGTFRNHWIMPDGSTRHTAWFSIIEEEWPTVKASLIQRLNCAS